MAKSENNTNAKNNSKDTWLKNLGAESQEYIHFLKLDEEKKTRVLVAAYNEFLEKGYAEASTNVIIQKAGISKGLLFHYFGCKEGLYRFLMREATRKIASESLPELPDKDADVFALIKSIIQVKISVCLHYPTETNFMLSAWKTNLPESLKQELENMVDIQGNYINVLVALLDDDLLKDGVEKNIAIEMIAWICEKYTDKLLSGNMLDTQVASWDLIAQDLDKYLDALRGGLYK